MAWGGPIGRVMHNDTCHVGIEHSYALAPPGPGRMIHMRIKGNAPVYQLRPFSLYLRQPQQDRFFCLWVLFQ